MSGNGWDRRKDDVEWVTGKDYDQMWTHGPKTILWGLVMVALVVFGGFQIRRWLLPADEALRRDVYEESKSYLDGTVRDLDNLRMQWLAADNEEHRAAIAATARHRVADFPDDRLPERLREWLKEIRP